MLEERHDEEKQGKKTTSHLVIIKTAEILSKSRCSTLCSRPCFCYILHISPVCCKLHSHSTPPDPIHRLILRYFVSLTRLKPPVLPPSPRELDPSCLENIAYVLQHVLSGGQKRTRKIHASTLPIVQQESYHVGRHVAQGLFSLHTSVGLVGWGKEPSNNDVCMEGCVLRGLDLFRVPKTLRARVFWL